VSIGVLGGTFDPIHLGHLRAAENARVALGLSRVLMVPARVPPHRGAPFASPWDRWAMTVLACAGIPELVPSDLELQREGPSYTVDTVAAVQASTGGDVVLIVGEDAFAEVGSWKDSAALVGQCRFAVVGRPSAAPAEETRFPAVRVPSSELAVSSSALRARIKEGMSVRFLVPEAVADYIAKRGLYR
jgi:nicotinate-nucleotide adenylyltransferase